MSRNVRLTLLCEDKQQRVFAQRFFRALDWNLRDWTPITAPDGLGSAEQFVRTEFPRQLKALREKGDEQVYLVVMIDGDSTGARQRRRQIDEACRAGGIDPPSAAERVLICTPTWNIETWIAYLSGESVDEAFGEYPKFTGRESRCQQQAVALATMCREGRLRSPAPESLENACAEYRRVFESA